MKRPAALGRTAGRVGQVLSEGTPGVEGETVPRFNSRQARTRWIRSVRLKLLAENGVCFYCGEPLVPKRATIDHEVPRSRGGPDEEWNFLLSCYRCNQRKGARSIGSCVCQLRRGAGLFSFNDALRRGLVDREPLTDGIARVD